MASKTITNPIIMLFAVVLLLTAGCVAKITTSPAPTRPDTAGETGPEREELTLTTSDGISLAATYYRPQAGSVDPGSTGLPAPPSSSTKGIALLHMLDKDRSTWKSFAPQAQARGYHIIAIDLRGHGDSDGNWRDFTDDDFNAAINDVKAAVAALEERGATEIAVAGASIGANLALRYAAENDLTAVVLLSPGLDYHGVTTDDAMALVEEPVFIAVAGGDTYSADSSASLEELREDAKLVTLGGTNHGTDLFKQHPTLIEQILQWLP